MKKFLSDFFLRGLVAAAFGPPVLAIIYWILGVTGAVESFPPNEVALGILTIELLALVVRHQEDLLGRLNEEEKEIFEKFADCTTEMHDLTEREAFVKGFTLGAKIIIEVLTNNSNI